MPISGAAPNALAKMHPESRPAGGRSMPAAKAPESPRGAPERRAPLPRP